MAHPMRTLNHYFDQTGQTIITDLNYLATIRDPTRFIPAQYLYQHHERVITLELRYVLIGEDAS